MSFSAHADAKGIMQLIKNCEPKNVVLVHGENLKMDFLKNQIQKEYGTKRDVKYYSHQKLDHTFPSFHVNFRY